MMRRAAGMLSKLGPVKWPVIGVVALVVFNVVMDILRGGWSAPAEPGGFLHISLQSGAPSGPLVDILNHASEIVILALGMALVIATRGVDLSVGSIMAVGGAIAATLAFDQKPVAVSVAAALGLGALCGLWNGVLVAVMRMQPFVATLVFMVAGRGIAQLLTKSQIVTFHSEGLEFIGNGRLSWAPLPFPFLLAMTMFGLTAIATRRTALGLLIEAVGGNPEASRLAGVRSRMLIIGVYVFSGVCAAVAGLINIADIRGADPFHAGLNLELSAIFAVVVGGTSLAGGRFSLTGAVAGGILMQTLTTTVYARNVSADIAPLPQAMVILAVCLAASPAMRQWWARRRAVR